MVAKGCGSEFPTIKTYRNPTAVTQYINYTVIKRQNQQRNSNRFLKTSFAGVSTYSDWLVIAAAEAELAAEDFSYTLSHSRLGSLLISKYILYREMG
jgi:hypothetical protein